MDERFMLFINDIPVNNQAYVMELDQYLMENGCKREIKPAKSGYVATYNYSNTGKSLLNYVFRKTGVKMRIYAKHIGEYAFILKEFPEKMKKEIIKAADCKKLTGGTCSPTCPAGYTFVMDGVEHRKCRSMAFFHELNEESGRYIKTLLEQELKADEKELS